MFCKGSPSTAITSAYAPGATTPIWPDMSSISAARALQADAAVRVTRDFLPPAVRFVDNGLEFVERQRGLRHEFSILADPGAVRHVDLDPVGAMVELLARRFAGLDWAVDDLCSLRHDQFGRVAFEVVSARRRDGARRDEQARPGNVTALDGL